MPTSPSQFESDVDFDRSLPIDFCLRLPDKPPIKDLLRSWASEIDQEERPDNMRRSPKTLLVLECLLANLLAVQNSDKRGFLAIPFRAQAYETGRYSKPPAKDTIFRRVRDHLVNLEPPAAQYKSGFFDRRTGGSRLSRLRATDALLNRLRSAYHESGLWIEQDYFPLITNQSSEVIRLKNESKQFIDYSDNEETNAMRARLRAWNIFASYHWIDLAIPDGTSIGQIIDSEDNIAGDETSESLVSGSDFALPDFSRNWLYRVFNRSSFNLGGRFYGGWWQSIQKDFRRRIMIQGETTREVDYSGMLIRMLYHREGVILEGDPYEISGIDNRYRGTIKKALLASINASEGQQIRSPPSDTLPMAWNELLERVRERHQPIARHFRSGVGLAMQRLDSDIAELVMIGMARQNLLVLPIHDSFIVPYAQVETLKQAMKSAYRSILGGDIVFSVDVSFIDQELGVNADEIEGVDPEVFYAAFDNDLGSGRYSRYWARERAYRSLWGEEFIHRQLDDYYGPPEALRLFEGLPEPIYGWRNEE